MLVCLYACPESADDGILMWRARKHCDSAGSDREDRMLGLGAGTPTDRTVDSAGWAMF